MDASSWLTKYPRAAAMLQGDDDVLLYADEDEAIPPSVALEGDGMLSQESLQARGPRPIVVSRGYELGSTMHHWRPAPMRAIPSDAHDPAELAHIPRCETTLDERVYTLGGQPCPCGEVRWYHDYRNQGDV